MTVKTIIIERGCVYLANLNPSKGTEPGKIRPVLVLQNDTLNKEAHPSVVILPLSTLLIDDVKPLRVRFNAREKLKQQSDILCDQIRAIDAKRITSDALCKLSINELAEVEHCVQQILGIKP